MRTRVRFPFPIAALAMLAFPCLAPAVSGQEVMKFERVSPESAAAMEQRNGSTPPRPQDSEAPESPEPPEAEVSRGGDVVRIGSDIHIERNQVVEGDVFALRGDIRVDGHVKGNVATTGGDVRLGPNAKVDGDVMCIGGELIEDAGATVLGQRVTALRGRGRVPSVYRDPEREEGGGRWDRRHRAGAVGFSLSWLLMSMLIAWFYTKIAPTRTAIALDALRERPGTSLGVGFLMVLLLGPSVVALALAMAILCITIIGIPLALLLMPAYGVLIMVVVSWGFTLGASIVGQQLTGRWPSLMSGQQTSIRRYAVLGAVGVSGMLLASAILRFLPFFGWVSTLLWVLGWVAFGFITVAGAGALMRSKFGLGPEGRWWPPFAPGPKPAPATASAPPTPPVAPPPAPPVTPPFPENPPATS